ncbi:hypothetical protein BZM27_10375 [Paraburkholderia steynii]|uniref:EthD domain-containing protein n=1 Tax=Paraburkholderia steynii TaxID=1245441 RepID=A0A4V2NHF5_9BURK|nr:hypothetical protein BZM27_10375 [Paraburkholderia steynii]
MSNFVAEKLFRPPHVQTRPGGSGPLTVLFSLLSRADTTPLDVRRLGDGYTLDKSGQPLRDPAKDSSAIGFESNPNVSFEHWGEYWRKVHGVRFTHIEEDNDRSLERLLRYDQLHRFAPGPTSFNAPPYRAPADESGMLWPTILGHIEPYQRPRLDGVAYLNFESIDDIAAVFANERVRTKILPEDLTMFRDIAPVLARQHIIIPSESGNEAVTLVKLHVRRKDEARESFQQWWLEDHGPYVSSHCQGSQLVKRYAQLHNIGGREPGEAFFHPDAATLDGISLMSFSSLADLEDFLVSPMNASIVEHESLKTEQAASEYWTTIGMMIVNRIRPEVRTA